MKRFNQKQGLQFFAAASLAFLAVGCGKQRQGQYQGTEIVQVNASALSYLPTNSGSPSSFRAQVALHIQETNSELVSGSWSSKSANGSFTGYLMSDQITNLVLNRSASSSVSSLTNSAYPVSVAYSTTDGSIAAICTGEYMGSIKFDGDRMTGTLQPTNNNPMYAQYYSQSGQCTQIDVDAVKISK